jgi:pentatricopeptide repeat protein
VSTEDELVSYKIVINAVCEMGLLNIVPLMLDSVTFNTLLNGFYNNGRVLDGGKIWCMVHDNRISEAIKLLEEMRSKGINMYVISYSALIKGFCIDGKLEEAEWWYQNMLVASQTSCRRTWKPLWCPASCYVAVDEILHLTTIFPLDFSWSLMSVKY